MHSLKLLVILLIGSGYGYFGNQPMIGVVLETTEAPGHSSDYKCPGLYAAQSTYKSFIEQSGGGAVPIFVNQSQEYYEQLIPRLNGVIFPGGGVNLINSYYGKVGYLIYKAAMRMNDQGNYFPILGLCLGMQEMTTWPMNPRINPMSDSIGTGDISLPLHFTDDATGSRLFDSMPPYIFDILAHQNVTPNYHEYALMTKTYANNKSLKDFYKVLSINYDKVGHQFVSTIESRKYPFYGVQWHPEKIAYWHTPNNHISHSLNATLVSQYMSNFFISEARKSTQSFKSIEESGRFMFQNFPVLYSPTELLTYYCLNDTNVPKFDN